MRRCLSQQINDRGSDAGRVDIDFGQLMTTLLNAPDHLPDSLGDIGIQSPERQALQVDAPDSADVCHTPRFGPLAQRPQSRWGSRF